MPTDLDEALALLKRINAWALNDIGFDCAKVNGCTVPSLPRRQKHIWPLLADKHHEFFDELAFHGEIDLGSVTHYNTASYNPTDRCYYHRPDNDHPDTIALRADVKDFFLGRPLDVMEGRGHYGGPYEFNLDFAIALDTKNGLIFSFVWNLAD